MKGRPPHRPWAGFWTWRDKPVAERGAADVILRQAKFQVAQLKSRRDDPPDCEAMLDRRWSAIEVTELVHEQALAQSMKALKERAAGRAGIPRRDGDARFAVGCAEVESGAVLARAHPPQPGAPVVPLVAVRRCPGAGLSAARPDAIQSDA